MHLLNEDECGLIIILFSWSDDLPGGHVGGGGGSSLLGQLHVLSQTPLLQMLLQASASHFLGFELLGTETLTASLTMGGTGNAR